MNAPVPVDVLPDRPYPGLRAFRQDEWPIFFGREEHADEVISRIGRHGLVLVHGASGCGKSSLVRAGVLPSLETDHEIGGRTWRTATMRPSEGLLTRLADVLEQALPQPTTAAADELGEPDSSQPRSWAELVVKGGGLVSLVEDALRERGGSLCLLVDQFEEIFRWAKEKSEAEARLFIEILKNVNPPESGSGFFVILTMRSDYLGSCAAYDGFAEFLNPRQYLLPKMDEFGLLRAIHEPAELYGGAIEPSVASLLLPVVNQQLDGLPVLQHALMRASDHARKRYKEDEQWTVTADDLAEVGGAEHALSEHADQVFAAATAGKPKLEEATEWMFRALTDLDADRRAIRRPCRLQELLDVSGVSREDTLKILDAFRAPDCVFISPYLPEPLTDQAELDISHEALIRQWSRLCGTDVDATNRPIGWVYREYHDGWIWRSLAVQAEKFAGDQKQLLSVATTEQRLPWFAAIKRRPGWTRRHVMGDVRSDCDLFDRQWRNVSEMMDASGKKLASEKTLIGRLRGARNFSLALLAAALFLMAWAMKEQQKAEIARGNAVTAEAAARETNKRLSDFGEALVPSLCSAQYKSDDSQRKLCLSAVGQQFRSSVDFQTGRQLKELKGSDSPARKGKTGA